MTLTSHISLEDIFSWAINLASCSNPPNHFRRNCRTRAPTPHPNIGIASPSRNTSSSSDPQVVSSPVVGFVPNRDISRINQANSSEPIFPSIASERQIYTPVAVHAPRPAPAPIVEHTSESKETRFVPPRANKLHCYYPEAIYVSSVLPTRTPLELHKFRQRCQILLRESPAQTGSTLSHPL